MPDEIPIPDNEPDLEAVVLSCIAQLLPVPLDEWTNGNLRELGIRYHRLRALMNICRFAADEIEEDLAATMETDIVDVPGVGRLLRSEVHPSSWRADNSAEQMRDDLARAVAQSIALDIATGEIDEMKRNVAMATMRAAYEAIPSFSSLKQAGRRRFGLMIGDYRTYDTRYRVTVEEA